MERRHPEEVSASVNDVNIVLRGSTCIVTRGNEVLAQHDAPFHSVSSSSNAIPAFDTHSDVHAADCLAELLPHCDLVALAVMDDASMKWSPNLTSVLNAMGAKHVPPAYRSSWAFLWIRTDSAQPLSFEQYKLSHEGKAELEIDVSNQGITERFLIASAGWFSGYTATMTISAENVLPSASRGVNIYVRGCSRPDIRRFAQVQFCSNFIHHSAEENGTLAIATGLDKTTRYKRLPSLFYQNLARLGGTGRVLNPSEAFILVGRKLGAYPPIIREMPSGEIADALRRPLTTGQTGYAYVSLFFGDKETFLSGALVLGKSLEQYSPHFARILLVSDDVPSSFRKVLASSGWMLKGASFIYGAYSMFHESAKFPPEIFMKLHIFNPSLLPYEKVLFLDLDTIVRTDISYLFATETPAAVNNWKMGDVHDISREFLFKPGEVMDPKETSFNAGVILVTPNRKLFDVLVQDITTPAKHHSLTWTPEQSYLGTVFTGHLRHLTLDCNFEVQLHGGTYCSRAWAEMPVEAVKIVHFSGDKPWIAHPHDEVNCCQVKFDNVKETFRAMSAPQRQLATARAVQYASEWHALFNTSMVQIYSFIGEEEKQLPLGGLTASERMERFSKRCEEKSLDSSRAG
eukprot:GEMP01007614.1.p1 GENE.GEMP01007614.1~~GEMP01007614.1.p1  ORF type:complete len:630 (+),score=106.99 GEMP01007614.1:119-2008(+)